MAEDFLTSSMVPGLVTVEGPDGKQQNVFPIDARELVRSGDYKLVENGALEAARMNANPIRSGRGPQGMTTEMVAVEVTGREGKVVASADPSVVEQLKAAGASEEPKPASGPAPGPGQDAANAKKSAAEAPKAPAPKADDKK